MLVQSPWTLLDGAQGPSINPCRSPFYASNGIIIPVSASFVLTTRSLFQRSCESTLSAALGAHTRGDRRRTQRAPLSYEFSSAVVVSANSASGIAVSHSPNEVRHRITISIAAAAIISPRVAVCPGNEKRGASSKRPSELLTIASSVLF